MRFLKNYRSTQKGQMTLLQLNAAIHFNRTSKSGSTIYEEEPENIGFLFKFEITNCVSMTYFLKKVTIQFKYNASTVYQFTNFFPNGTLF